MSDQNNPDGRANGIHLQEEMAQQPPIQQNNFMNVRDRLFHTILVRAAITYSNTVPLVFRKIIEFVMLLTALSFLGILLFVHFMSTRTTANCMDSYNTTWPKDGVIHLEVVEHLNMLEYKEEWIRWYTSERSQASCHFDLREVFLYGPSSIPAEARQRRLQPHLKHDFQNSNSMANEEDDNANSTVLGRIFQLTLALFGKNEEWNEGYETAEFEEPIDPEDPFLYEAEAAFNEMFSQQYDRSLAPRTVYRMEYAQFYGLLRLPMSYRKRQNISTLHVRIDANAKCFGDSVMLYTLKNLIGYEEAVMSSLRKLAANESMDDSGLGYLHNLDTNEHYHFVTHGMSKTSYLTAALVMVGFTFAISLLLRFSHHQIFVFIVEVLHMFETNQPIQFPAASLLTVILALVGMEAIMSEVFSDTSTAFYVILVVWIADQFDAICCQSQTSRRFWLRFFYLYQFFFYAYQYRFGGQYGGIALLTSIAFVTHSMVYFFHHYEMPLILYQERLQRILSEIQASPRMEPAPTPSNTQRATQFVPPGNSRSEDPPMEDSHQISSQSTRTESTAQVSNSDPPDSEHGRPTVPEERVAQEVVSEAIEELFLPN